MSDSSVVVRRVLRRRIKSNQGVENLVGEMLGDEWQGMLNSGRQARDGMVQKVAGKIDLMLSQSSFVEPASSEE